MYLFLEIKKTAVYGSLLRWKLWNLEKFMKIGGPYRALNTDQVFELPITSNSDIIH